MPDLEDHRTETAATPANCTELFRVAIHLVNEVRLVKIFCASFRLTPRLRLTA
jgi:hypothetical protein